MISKRNLVMLFHLFVCIHINYGGGYPCLDGSQNYDCSCSTGTSGTIGTCSCAAKTPTNVRKGQPCAYDSAKGVDSVS